MDGILLVIPAQAGIQVAVTKIKMDPGFRSQLRRERPRDDDMDGVAAWGASRRICV